MCRCMEAAQKQLWVERQGPLPSSVTRPRSLFPCQEKGRRPIKQFTKEIPSENTKEF